MLSVARWGGEFLDILKHYMLRELNSDLPGNSLLGSSFPYKISCIFLRVCLAFSWGQTSPILLLCSFLLVITLSVLACSSEPGVGFGHKTPSPFTVLWYIFQRWTLSPFPTKLNWKMRTGLKCMKWECRVFSTICLLLQLYCLNLPSLNAAL